MTPLTTVATLAECYDVIVVGAGPAGLAAAATAAAHGLAVLLVDENPAPGGQIWRAITTTPVTDRAVLGADYWKGADHVARFSASGAHCAPRCTVWSIDADSRDDGCVEIGVSMAGAARMIAARHVILATGAQERPFAIPGWTLPGVMAAGAAQIALKSSAIVPAGRVVLAGCGPLLFLLAGQLAAAGADIVALLDTTPAHNRPRAVAHAPAFALSPYLRKGLALLRAVRREVDIVGGVTRLAANGAERLTGVSYVAGGRTKTIACDALLLHHGVIPQINLSSATGCAHDFDAGQHAFVPRLDDWFFSTVPGVSIAGDGGGIGGAESAASKGELAALAVAARLGALAGADRDRLSRPARSALTRALRGRRFLDLLYRPARQFLAPPDETIVCRCEEVTAGQIRDAARRLGVVGPNQMKAFLRCGMGPCQGRLCGPTVVELIAGARGKAPGEVGYYRLRPPVKPLTLGELAALPGSEDAIRAVGR